MITLYHGSNVPIDNIDLSLCNPNKDFGQGFYLTDIEEQAQQMATRRTHITGKGSPTVTTFAFDETLLNGTELRIKRFETPYEEWALFVLANRETGRMDHQHNYDIVIGPIADDGVVFQLERYTKQMITLEALVNELTFCHPNRQYFFGTELSISKLQKQ